MFNKSCWLEGKNGGTRTGEKERAQEHRKEIKKKVAVRFYQKFLKLKFPHHYRILAFVVCDRKSISTACIIFLPSLPRFIRYCFYFVFAMTHLFSNICIGWFKKKIFYYWTANVQRNIIAPTCLSRFYFHTYLSHTNHRATWNKMLSMNRHEKKWGTKH